jgi:hypothetical protein
MPEASSMVERIVVELGTRTPNPIQRLSKLKIRKTPIKMLSLNARQKKLLKLSKPSIQ